MDQNARVLARSRLEAARQQVPELLAGPDEFTPAYETWVSSVKRSLRLGFGDEHVMVREFDDLTMIYAAGAVINRSDPSRSWSAVERKRPHEVLRATEPLLQDAIELLPHGASAASSVAAGTGAAPADAASSTPRVPTALISYAWDTPEEDEWIEEFAARLRRDGVDAIIDRWAAQHGDPLPAFMERETRERDFVLIICTRKYKAKSDGRQGGVGYEGNIMTAEILSTANHRKFIPVVRQAPDSESVPTWLAGKRYVNLTEDPPGKRYESEYAGLVATLHGEVAGPPPLVPRRRPPDAGTAIAPPVSAPAATARTGVSSASHSTPPQDPAEPIRILGVIAEEVGRPRNDGTRGSALYEVPLRLSRRPSDDWAELFVQTWNRPPVFTTRHRPGIARVEGDRVILDGTTLEEVKEVHRETLKAVIERVNQDIKAELARARAAEERERERRQQHDDEVRRLAGDIDFD